MAVAKKSTGTVAVSPKYTVGDVPSLLQQAQEKLEQLTGGGKGSVKEITDALPGFGQLKHISEPEDLVKAMSSVDGKEAAFKAAFKKHFSKIASKAPVFTIEGHSPSLWRSNIIARYTELTNEVETAKVKEAIRLLKENLSKDEKFNTDMKSIVGLFS